jgi:tRNA G18 (ribose-2'-O)-methylase SpoU
MLAKTSKRFSSMPFRQADRFARNSPSAAPASSYKRFPGGGARGPNSADHPAQDLLYGKHVVSMALAWRPETCKKLYVQEGAPVQEAIQAASARNIPIEVRARAAALRVLTSPTGVCVCVCGSFAPSSP